MQNIWNKYYTLHHYVTSIAGNDLWPLFLFPKGQTSLNGREETITDKYCNIKF